VAWFAWLPLVVVGAWFAWLPFGVVVVCAWAAVHAKSAANARLAMGVMRVIGDAPEGDASSHQGRDMHPWHWIAKRDQLTLRP
jgi:hypothetical protein